MKRDKTLTTSITTLSKLRILATLADFRSLDKYIRQIDYPEDLDPSRCDFPSGSGRTSITLRNETHQALVILAGNRGMGPARLLGAFAAIEYEKAIKREYLKLKDDGLKKLLGSS